MKKKVTIQDIADAVGYSKTTVSRYINGQDLIEFYAKNNALYSVRPKNLDETVEAIEKHLKSI